MKRMTFKVELEPDDGGWHVYIPEVAGCRSWGRSIGAAKRNIREALSLCVDALGGDAEKVVQEARFVWHVELPAVVRRALDAALADRQRAEEALAAAQSSATKAARALTGNAGISLRDAGELLQLSHQRVKQLAG